MKQPVLVILEVPDGSTREQLRRDVERMLLPGPFEVIATVPLSYTLDVPGGAIVHG